MPDLCAYKLDSSPISKSNFTIFVIFLYIEAAYFFAILYILTRSTIQQTNGFIVGGLSISSKLVLSITQYFQPSTLEEDYSVNHSHSLFIRLNALQLCKIHDMFVLDFLFQSYRKHLNGVIVNVEQDFNPQLQTTIFLESVCTNSNAKACILVLCPDENIVKWHYYFKNRNFNVTVLSKDDEDADMEQSVLLVSFSNLKTEKLLQHEFFSIIIDAFEQVATKLFIKRLQSEFNIGISYRNFYLEPNQKVQWNMLNWANPGCVGKLNDFYQIDNDNLAQFRDNYKEWWFRLTWQFCDSFVKPTLEEKGKLNVTLREWAKEHHLDSFLINRTKKSRKRNEVSAHKVINKTPKKDNSSKKKDEVLVENDDTANSVGTVIYNYSVETVTDLPDNEKSTFFEEDADTFLKTISRKTHILPKIRSDFLNQIVNSDSQGNESIVISNDTAPLEDENFLKKICTQTENKIEDTSATESEVDKLVADVFSMIN